MKDFPLLSIMSLPSAFIHSEEAWLDMEDRDIVDMLKVLNPPNKEKQHRYKLIKKINTVLVLAI